MYASAEPCDPTEFIELHNASEQEIDLSGWRISGGVEYAFPMGQRIVPGGHLVVAADPGAVAAAFDLAPLGPWTGTLANEGEELLLEDRGMRTVDELDYSPSFPWPVAAAGEGSSMALVNAGLDNARPGAWRSSRPSPGARNPVSLDNPPPLVDTITHWPRSPRSGEPVTISAEVRDVDGVDDVTLHFQVVAPGDYLPAHRPHGLSVLRAPDFQRDRPQEPDPRFEDAANWHDLVMRDDGIGADQQAGDGVYTASVPGQDDRTLVRYRVSATDNRGAAVRVPYADDPSLNFALYVHDGVPDYAAERSVRGGQRLHGSKMLTQLPVYTLLTREDDYREAVAYAPGQQLDIGTEGWRAYNWGGTLIYDDTVYDHIRYRLRGANGRYLGTGKRSMKFRFNRGHYFAARDQDGRFYRRKWRVLETSKMFSNHLVGNFGLVESVNGHLWRLLGVPAPLTHWFHFRVVDRPDAAPDQWSGDFHGMFLAMERYDGRFIAQHEIDDGNLYKLTDRMHSVADLKRHQTCNRLAPRDVYDFAVINRFLNAERSEQWIRDHTNLERWYRWAAVKEAVRHYDMPVTRLKNMVWYFEPDYTRRNDDIGRLWILPYDYDDTWGPHWEHGHDTIKRAVKDKEQIQLEYRNTLREFRDLVWQPDQINMLIESYAAVIRDFHFADRDRWSEAPPSQGHEDWGALETKVIDMMRYAWQGGRWPNVGGRGSFEAARADYLDRLALDTGLPATPVVSYSGRPGYPVDGLSFVSSDFSDSGDGFAAMEWRLAEVESHYRYTLSHPGLEWRHFVSDGPPPSDWRELDFDESTWLQGSAPSEHASGSLTFNVPHSLGRAGGGSPLTTYFRQKVYVDDPTRLHVGRIRLKVETGAAVYVNGRQVLPVGSEVRDPGRNRPAVTKPDGGDLQEFIFEPSMLVSGENQLAVELHRSKDDNTELAFGVEAYAMPAVRPSRLKLEWAAVWEAVVEEHFERGVRIPPGIVRPGHSYRARVRHQDDSKRWSHWSAPLEFVAGESEVAAPERALVISEFMPRPAGPTPSEAANGWTRHDFQFLELLNAGEMRIDLASLRMTDGVPFEFSLGKIRYLEPGARILVVRNARAMTHRYGPGLPITGEWGDARLATGGERLTLATTAGADVVTFSYDDYVPSHGTGKHTARSRVLIDPRSLPDHSDRQNWKLSARPGGTPGR